jgi:hypothetical protein
VGEDFGGGVSLARCDAANDPPPSVTPVMMFMCVCVKWSQTREREKEARCLIFFHGKQKGNMNERKKLPKRKASKKGTKRPCFKILNKKDILKRKSSCKKGTPCVIDSDNEG